MTKVAGDSWRCPRCGALVPVPAEAAGQPGCPACGVAFEVAGPPHPKGATATPPDPAPAAGVPALNLDALLLPGARRWRHFWRFNLLVTHPLLLLGVGFYLWTCLPARALEPGLFLGSGGLTALLFGGVELAIFLGSQWLYLQTVLPVANRRTVSEQPTTIVLVLGALCGGVVCLIALTVTYCLGSHGVLLNRDQFFLSLAAVPLLFGTQPLFFAGFSKFMPPMRQPEFVVWLSLGTAAAVLTLLCLGGWLALERWLGVVLFREMSVASLTTVGLGWCLGVVFFFLLWRRDQAAAFRRILAVIAVAAALEILCAAALRLHLGLADRPARGDGVTSALVIGVVVWVWLFGPALVLLELVNLRGEVEARGPDICRGCGHDLRGCFAERCPGCGVLTYRDLE